APITPDTDVVEQAIKWADDHGIMTLFSRGWKGLVPTMGGMVNGSGFAAGLQFLRTDLRDGDFVIRSSARISTKQYQLYDFDAGLPRLGMDRAYLDVYLRQRNYAQIQYYGPGPFSRKAG